MTNSAGLTMATPISVTTCPASRTSGGFVSASHLTKESLLRRVPEKGSGSPLAQQKITDGALDPLPETRIIWFENHKLRALFDGLAQEIQQAPGANIFFSAISITAQGARTPHVNVAVEVANAINSLRIEPILLGFAQVVLQPDRSRHRLVGGRLVDAAPGVNARVNSCYVAARWYQDIFPCCRVQDLNPWEVESRIGVILR